MAALAGRLPFRFDPLMQASNFGMILIGGVAPRRMHAGAPRVVFDTLGELSLGVTVYFWVDMSAFDSTLTARDRGMVLIVRALSETGEPMPVPVQSLVTQTNRP